jgi:amidase
MSNDLLDASALEQARLIRDGSLSSEELTRFYLKRIAEKNEGLQAFVTVFGRRALLAARRKDAERARSRDRADLPPFHGVPIGIKDLNGVRMAPRRLGSRAFKYLFWPVDDASVAQIRAGGFVFVGKLATSELGAMPVTEPDIHPPTRNPWDTRFTSGGSSGGSGAAVAAGLIPLAHGSDGAGSIRIPSSFCHLFGVKPSRGRVPNIIEHGDDAITTCGPLARNVDDAAAMLDVQAGLVSGKPTAAPRPEARFLELANREPPRLRIRFTLESPLCKTDPEIADTVRAVLKTLEGLVRRRREFEGLARAGSAPVRNFRRVGADRERVSRQAAKAPSEESSTILVSSLGGLAAWRLSSSRCSPEPHRQSIETTATRY